MRSAWHNIYAIGTLRKISAFAVVFFFVATHLSASSSLSLLGLEKSPPLSREVRIAILDSDFGPGSHGHWLEALVKNAAPGAYVLPINSGGTLGQGLEALAQAKSQNAEVVLFGYGHNRFSQKEYDKILAAVQEGMVLVAPAGNGGNSERLYPGAYPMVIGVGSTDNLGSPARFGTIHSSVRFFAPAENIPAPENSGLTGTATGSSFAAAEVAGLAAQMLSEGIQGNEIFKRMEAGRVSVPGISGVGIPNLGTALRPAPESTPAPEPLGHRIWERRRPKGDFLFIATPKAASESKKFHAAMAKLGGQFKHEFPPQGFIARLDPSKHPALSDQGWIQKVYEFKVPEQDLENLNPSGKMAAVIWNDVFQGGLSDRGKEGNGQMRSPAVFDAPAKGHVEKNADDATLISPQGLYTTSPPYGAGYYDTSCYLAGDVAVGIFLPQADGVADTVRTHWTNDQQNNVVSEIVAAMSWIQGQNPEAKINFVYDLHLSARCDYEPIVHPRSFIGVWMPNVLGYLGLSGISEYVQQLRITSATDWAFAIFVANSVGYPSNGCFTDGSNAYVVTGGLPFMAMTYDLGSNGIGQMDTMSVIGTGMMFGADMEFCPGVPPSTTGGYFNSPNRNSYFGGSMNDPRCPMRGYSVKNFDAHWCSATQLQIGHRDLDSDGITDALDTHPLSSWMGSWPSQILSGQAVDMTGTSRDIALPNLNPYGGGSVTLNGITSVLYRLNGGAWNFGIFSDGIGGQSVETFHFSTGPLFVDTLVEARAVNSSGNTETASVSWMFQVVGTPTISPTPSVSPTITSTFSPGPSPTPALVGCLALRTVAGNGPVGSGGGSFTGDGGLAGLATLNNPSAVAVDGFGNWFICDSANYRIRKVNVGTGIIQTIAGNGSTAIFGDGGPATSAGIGFASGIVTDGSGNVYFSSSDNFRGRVRKINVSTGVISTIAGMAGNGYTGDGIVATSLRLNSPEGIAFDTAENLFIADKLNNRIRRVDKVTGVMTTVAGNGVQGYSGDGGLATSATLNYPNSVAADSSGNIYFFGNRSGLFRQMTSATMKETLRQRARPDMLGSESPAGHGSAFLALPLR